MPPRKTIIITFGLQASAHHRSEVGLWHIASNADDLGNSRFWRTPDLAGQRRGVARARMALSRPSTNLYSITSSVSASSLGGMSRPSTLAVLRLITSSNLVGCVTGKSAGLTPLRIRPA
jgi:hypothetical protein